MAQTDRHPEQRTWRQCSSSTVATNATITAFIEVNKLKLAHKKCAKICVGGKCDNCPNINVHDAVMKESQEEINFGDIISSK